MGGLVFVHEGVEGLGVFGEAVATVGDFVVGSWDGGVHGGDPAVFEHEVADGGEVGIEFGAEEVEFGHYLDFHGVEVIDKEFH